MKTKILVTIIAAFGLCTSASALPIQFSYVFGDSTVVSAVAEGDLQADGDTFTNLSQIQVSINGVDQGPISWAGSWSGWPGDSTGAVVSLSGLNMDFIFGWNGFTSASCCNTPGESYWLWNSVVPPIAFTQLDQLLATPYRLFSADAPQKDSWNATIPEPSTLALLGIGLLSLGLARRRKQ